MEQPVAPNDSFTEEQPNPVSPRQPQPTNGLRDFLSIVGVLASALVLAYGLINYVFQSYQVDGPSMQTTLQNDDHLIVWKVPRSVASITGHHYIPKRGDIIVFKLPEGSINAREPQLIKRVMALPGERITIHDNVVTVYNQAHPDGFHPDQLSPYGKVITVTPGNEDVTIPDDQLYVMGDHRDNSKDSRSFGAIQSQQIVGKLVARLLPLNTFQRF